MELPLPPSCARPQSTRLGAVPCRGSWPPKKTLPRPEGLYLPALEVATQKFAEAQASKEGLYGNLVSPFAFYYPAPKGNLTPAPLPQSALAQQRTLKPRPTPSGLA